jgi:hypothetical protein
MEMNKLVLATLGIFLSVAFASTAQAYDCFEKDTYMGLAMLTHMIYQYQHPHETDQKIKIDGMEKIFTILCEIGKSNHS